MRLKLAHGDSVCIQQGAYLLELSLDWIVLRASENIHHLLGELHVTRSTSRWASSSMRRRFTTFEICSRKLSGTTGIGRAYAVRLTDDPDLVDIAFQLVDGRALLEAAPSMGVFGESFGKCRRPHRGARR